MARILRKQILSMRGVPVDFGSLQAQNPQQPTLGNSRTNVKGDILGNNATVLKTQAEVEAEWARKRELQHKVNSQANIKADHVAPVSSNTTNKIANTEFPTIGELVDKGAIPTKKRIVDSD